MADFMVPHEVLTSDPKNLLVAYAPDCPEGICYDKTRTSLKRLADDGWVDSPAKLGINIWGESAAHEVARVHAEYRAGNLAAFKELGPEVDARSENDKLRATNELLLQQLEDEKAKTRMREAEDTDERHAHGMEKDLDKLSEADKKTYRGMAPTPQAISQAKRVKDIDKEGETPPGGPEETDL